MGQRSR
jgi:hypothetical protein